MNKIIVFSLIGMIILGSFIFIIRNHVTIKDILPNIFGKVSALGEPTATAKGIEEEWWTTCADNVTIYFNKTKVVTLPNDDKNDTVTIIGGYAPDKHHYELFPECVNMRDMGNYLNMTCLLKLCKRIIQYNILNGTTREIWRKGQVW